MRRSRGKGDREREFFGPALLLALSTTTTTTAAYTRIPTRSDDDDEPKDEIADLWEDAGKILRVSQGKKDSPTGQGGRTRLKQVAAQWRPISVFQKFDSVGENLSELRGFCTLRARRGKRERERGTASVHLDDWGNQAARA